MYFISLINSSCSITAGGVTNCYNINSLCRALNNRSEDGGSCPYFLIGSSSLYCKPHINYCLSLESNVMWTKPSYQDMRLGFEITMYFKTR